MRRLLLCGALACGTPAPDPTPASTPASDVVAPGEPDAQLVERWFAAMERQLRADAAATAKRTFASDREIQEALAALTPAGFRPRPEFFRAVLDESQVTKRLAACAAAHPEEMAQHATLMMKRLEPELLQVEGHVKRQRQR